MSTREAQMRSLSKAAPLAVISAPLSPRRTVRQRAPMNHARFDRPPDVLWTSARVYQKASPMPDARILEKLTESDGSFAGSTPRMAGFFRRFGAMLYDTFLLFAVLFGAGAVAMLVVGGEISDGNPVYFTYLISVAYLFFAWFWLRAGQTLGMQTWRLRLVTFDGRKPNVQQTLLRFVGSLLSWLAGGLGFLWIFVDKDRLAWHDYLSGTMIIWYPRNPKTSE